MSISRPPSTSNRRRPAEQYAERDRAMLRATLRYQVLVAAMASAKFLEGKQAGHVLRRFEAKGWLQLETAAIPGGVTYATLTAVGAREVGVTYRPRPLGAARLDAALAVAGFCLLDAGNAKSRTRLTPQEVNRLDAGLAANVPHVLTDEFAAAGGGEPSLVVLRVLLASSGKTEAGRGESGRGVPKGGRQSEEPAVGRVGRPGGSGPRTYARTGRSARRSD
ncbi:hypothetical protein [Botrimarina mediterranea]|uniref:Uncharacterized protein n=1 Tax=Botrimarina mediterranea TaxID=2528022 RepID=A0A518K9U1_9BACT|nr:hypothetical protein [Botrimarina mediterranea]QDV74551.1 hypothetical protein Spa11_27550 [Botrimarina mediterranea]QDV79191.1 hypothetical protein K2D_28020 [Planctomycetes bacterium K2D]